MHDRRSRARLRTAAAILLVGVGLAGCLSAPAPTSDGPAPGQPTRIDLLDRDVQGRSAVTWNGSKLQTGGGSDCSGQACQRVPFELTGPLGDVDQLVVSATWDPYVGDVNQTYPTGDLKVRIEGPGGDVLANGSSVYWSAVAIADDPKPGSYVAEIRAVEGHTPYVGAVQVQSEPDGSSARDLLPDLVAMPVVQLTRERPRLRGTGPVDEAAGTRGCSPYEMTERDARSCLRFTTSIGNLGQGPLEVRLGFENATRAATPLESRFVQVIHRSDGSTRRVAGAEASFHPTHQHYHYHGVAGFRLYEYDLTNGSRGELVREGHKSAWCLVDMGLVAPGDANRTTRARYPIDSSDGPTFSSRQPGGGSNCQVATPRHDMVTGLSPGWYDTYEWTQDDQYIEVSGLADGTYELVVTADPDDRIVEARTDNNAGGVVFEWRDGEARVIERWSEAVD